MIKLEKIYKLCDGFEMCDRATAVKKLMTKGIEKSNAINYYNIWRRHYLESREDNLKLTGVFIMQGKNRKLLEECSYKERQKYLEALDKEQLIKITQAVLR
ncbi:hypothetical protein IRP63_08840 [Clostridium botulinum]|uniref:Uncharacterized protein n=1 Tax=Clostridium botulinum C/D str. DC5 TaxID=1443128 RepID=A0A0A0IF03_CLOBO|nr:hypothetical protein [Clostridium botulinum]KGM99567.1 hypothetical protein Z955_07010 [Clostridium botulinum C/D str. DC5]KOC52486.1 hypothetical protein ADU89_11295 [Clostridium botulinum]KOC56474.1 hypothetical protein ADU90_08185 [Clostridium botulinum]MCD3234369.1 hypothetical protein [Clostridium botulinum D/C]MCD3240193.1 hypothetical protein [Clostridium botulinum D/C]